VETQADAADLRAGKEIEMFEVFEAFEATDKEAAIGAGECFEDGLGRGPLGARVPEPGWG
jgi:hypothetical protein